MHRSKQATRCRRICRSIASSPPRAAATTTTTRATDAVGTDAVDRRRPTAGGRRRPRPRTPTHRRQPTATDEADRRRRRRRAATRRCAECARRAPRHRRGRARPGRHLVYGIEADTANPWAPYRASCADSGYIMLGVGLRPAVHERRGRRDRAACSSRRVEPQRRLHASGRSTSATASSSTTARRSTAPPSSSTSTPAVRRRSRRARSTPIEHVTASGQDVTITTKGGPWVALPAYFTDAPVRLHAVADSGSAACADVPQRNPRARRSTTPRWRRRRPTATRPKPVGLGAFMFESYTPGNGNSFKAVRNEDYWRGPNGITGEDLPYLDAIEARRRRRHRQPLQRAALGPVRHHAHGERRHDQAVPRRRRASR